MGPRHNGRGASEQGESVSITRIRELCSDAETLLEAGQAELAQKTAERAVEEATTYGHDASLAMATMILAWICHASGKLDECRDHLERSLKIGDSLSEIDFDGQIVVMKHACHLLAELGDAQRARGIADNILKKLSNWHSPEHPIVAHTRLELAAWVIFPSSD